MNTPSPKPSHKLIIFRRNLQVWYSSHGRSFPWRESVNRTSYRTAIAELMLRRTRADQVVPVYRRFVERFPTLATGAVAADQDTGDVEVILYPLGLAWRAATMLAFLREAHMRFGNDLPDDASVLLTLPGIGEYVSEAIQCFAGGKFAVLIDVNVVRVLGRVFGLDTTGEARRRRAMRELAAEAVDTTAPADYHYALLDFAAVVCTARTPHCHSCPMRRDEICDYYRTIVAPNTTQAD